MKCMLMVPVLGSALLVSVLPAKAASICKGVPTQTECEAKQVYQGVPACRWMPLRERADGGATRAHCRGSGKSVPAGATKITAETTKTN